MTERPVAGAMKIEDDGGEKMPICHGLWNCSEVASIVRKGGAVA